MSTVFQEPPQAPPLFNYTADTVNRLARSIVDTRRKLLDKIASTITRETATFENVVEAIARDYDYASINTRVIYFYDYEIDSSTREDVFQLIDAVHSKRGRLSLCPEDLRLIERMHKQSISDGLGIVPGPKRDHFKKIRARLDALQAKYKKNLVEEKGFIWLERHELDGVPEDVICTLEQANSEDSQKLRLTFKYPHLRPVLGHATDPDVRQRVWLANQNKCPENAALFNETILLRDEAARMLGFKSHATRKLRGSMAKNPEKVWAFLTELQSPLTLAAEKELSNLRGIKARDCIARGLKNDGNFYFWDLDYYERLMLESQHGVDFLQIAEYFPLDNTVSAMLNIFESLMGLTFEKLGSQALARLSPTGQADDVRWHRDNLVFSAWERGIDCEQDDTVKFLGYLYMDLHPREGKYGHLAQYNLQPGFTLRDGTRHYPAAALLCNYSLPTADKPALLKHSEVVNLFHELGHAIHNLSSKTMYCKLHGTANPRDFVEAPSQMLEHWCWTPSVLKSVSRHWNTGQNLPDALIDGLVATKNVNSALADLRDLQLALFDMKCHDPESHDQLESLSPTSLYQELLTSTTLLQGPDLKLTNEDWSHGYANHVHLMGGYDAGYYGYLYSKVFSTDMFYSAFRMNPMDERQGRKYRQSVLEYGSSRDELQGLTEFLGREPSSEAFHQELGIADYIGILNS
ncbi:hypothetical protein LMH87_002409 [Akanthomyces muscarius]|uniref:Peptidase M3A/M3B catalytic domain-containing protein n=1 Tax=Akanthomyces muscarius TaxID=2231603 RepID=A0A9W8Q6T0_AKAMU|nr:hypothetical protein LMH87_002409 [Akanthomyces muscarius]KAJ4147913.1 hypothetical protein LMH87_002409 [Akanthomyces muscarius]